MAYHPKVVDLSDDGLVKAAVLVSKRGEALDLNLSGWEAAFLVGLPDFWTRYGSISWKQRKHARAILTKAIEELERRDEMARWTDEVAAESTGKSGV